MIRLTSRQHPLVRRCRQIASGRGEPDTVLLDGAHVCEVALANHVPIDVVLTTQADARVVRDAAQAGAEVYEVTSNVMDAASPVRTPTGLVALARWQPHPPEDLLTKPAQGLLVALVDVQDPGNVGSVIRSADALGGAGVLALGKTAAPGNWKSLRAAMGSTFRIPIGSGEVEDALALARARGWTVAATVARHGAPLMPGSFSKPALLLLGSEGGGLSDSLVARADTRVTIPMRDEVESLNVAITAALCLYEVRRSVSS
jgi:RNA methyltransferase, TrmH family